MSNMPAPRWDLDSAFPGGSKSNEFKNHREECKTRLKKLEQQLSLIQTDLDNDTKNDWTKFILEFQSLAEDVVLILSFGGCLSSQNVSDAGADAIISEGSQLYSGIEKIRTNLEANAMKQSDEAWQMLLDDSQLSEIQYYLNELRSMAKSKMPVEMESLALELGVSGYHGWAQLYTKMAGELKVEFEQAGKTETLSLGQLASKFAEPDRAVRQQAFEKMTTAWKEREDLAAMILNNLAGFRLSLYKNRGWESAEQEPLELSRMTQATLDKMWEVIQRETGRLKPYIESKKKLLGIDKFSWFDQFAPCGAVNKTYSFDEAGDFIIKQFQPFSPEISEFVKLALAKNWVEAEDRPGKRGGAYCTSFGKFKQPRVFMTFSGTYDSLLTLAHELGHAYHSWLLKEKPYFSRIYAKNLAETASTFAEALVTDAAYQEAEDKQEKLMLLDQKLQAVYTMFCDIQSRYLFDQQLYTVRQEKSLSSPELQEMMVEAQKKAFGDLLDESGYHPYFWCSKLHFYLTDTPFYNFPYTFGYLFSAGVYALAKKEGSAFAENYRTLLTDTGSMKTEPIAQKHLGVDLTKDEFWVEAVNNVLSDVDEFVKLVDELI